MNSISNLIKTEPAVCVAVVDAVVVLLITFGLPITSDQKVAIDGVLTAISAIVAGGVTRQLVTPTSKLS